MALDFGKIKSQTSLSFNAFTQSYRSIDVCPLESTVLLLLRDFDPFNQIDDPSAPFSINDRDLLRVFWENQISNLTYLFAFTRSSRSGDAWILESDD
jgi:hypothetical protein